MFLHYNSISDFYLSGQEWRKLRKLMSPAFSRSTLEIYLEVFKNNAEILVQALMTKVGGGEFDVCPYLVLYSLDCTIGKYITVHLRNFNSYVVLPVNSFAI
jgi:cytochrome P450